MKRPKIKDLKIEKIEWKYENGKWIKISIYNIRDISINNEGENEVEKQPQYFKEFLDLYKSDQHKNDLRWEKQFEFNKNQLKFNKEQRIFNKNQLKFNEEQRIFNKNQLKFNEEQRIFNKNQLKFNKDQLKFNEEQKTFNKTHKHDKQK